ncbi:MAG: hypothetical protein U1D55_07435 [Phycisphaerae bacterium]
MEGEYRTAFEILGVPEEADDEAIRNRFADVHAEHGGGENDVPFRIRDAFAQLQSEGSRKSYLEVLHACREHRPLRIEASEETKFLNTCTLWEIELWRDRDRTDIFVYHVWQPTDGEPAVVTRQREREKAAPPGTDPFRWGRLLRTLSKPVAGAAVVAAVIWGWMAWTAHAEAQRQATLAGQMRAGIAASEKAIAAVETNRRTVFDEFQKLTGFSLTGATVQTPRPRELDRALLRHDSVRKAWDELLAEQNPNRDVAEFRRPLDTATGRLGAGSLNPADVDAVRSLERELADRVRQVEAQRENLRHIREMLEADRLERALEQPGRSSP